MSEFDKICKFDVKKEMDFEEKYESEYYNYNQGYYRCPECGHIFYFEIRKICEMCGFDFYKKIL